MTMGRVMVCSLPVCIQGLGIDVSGNRKRNRVVLVLCQDRERGNVIRLTDGVIAFSIPFAMRFFCLFLLHLLFMAFFQMMPDE